MAARKGPFSHKEFDSYVEPEPMSGCWLWIGARSGLYGALSRNGQRLWAHRFAWEQAFGPVPPGLHVRHICDNPPCVNPAHLRIGTAKDNMQDAYRRRRNPHWTRTACDRGHEYNATNTYYTATQRHCRVCRRERYSHV